MFTTGIQLVQKWSFNQFNLEKRSINKNHQKDYIYWKE